MAVQRTTLIFVGNGRTAVANKTYMLTFVDAKVAAALCKGGPVAYIVKDASGITNRWILDYVVPSMRQGLFCPNPNNAPNVFAAAILEQVCIIIGGVLLFKMFDSSPGEK
jgi:hypothetical protein